MAGAPRRCRALVAATVATIAALWAIAGAPAAVADPSVLAQWRFDEPSGQVALDDGAFGLDGRLGASDGSEATDPERVSGVSGGALRFGGGGYVRLPEAAELAPATLTLEAVVRGDGSPGRFRYLVAHGAEACIAGSYGIYTGDAGGAAFYVFDGKRFVISAAAAPGDVWDGRWHHVAAVFDGVALRLYVDGRPVGAAQPAALTIAYALTSNDTYFGMYRGSCALPLRGDVDLIRMWSGPLGPVTVARLADEALTPPAADAQTPPPSASVPDAPPVAVDPPDAPSPRPGLAAATPGSSSPAPALPTGGDGPPKSAPGAPLRACVVRPSVSRLRARRLAVITVRVSLRRHPLHRARVVATQASSHRVLASARTARNGRARLRLRPSRRGTVRLAVSGRRDCTTAALTVVAP
jgi:hypothetical protein